MQMEKENQSLKTEMNKMRNEIDEIYDLKKTVRGIMEMIEEM